MNDPIPSRFGLNNLNLKAKTPQVHTYTIVLSKKCPTSKVGQKPQSQAQKEIQRQNGNDAKAQPKAMVKALN